MDPIIGASLIAAGSNIVGGIMGNRSANRANARSDRQAILDRDLQREFAQHGLSWRVNDARASGLHPLAALGAQLSPGQPVGAGQYDTGSAKGDAIRAAGAAIAESIARAGKEKAETRLLNAQADFTEQQAADSLNARLAQGMQNDVVTPGFKEVQQQRTASGVTTPIMHLETGPWADAQTYEDRYGEVGGSVMGLGNILADFLYTTKNRFQRFVNKHSQNLDPVYLTFE